MPLLFYIIHSHCCSSFTQCPATLRHPGVEGNSHRGLQGDAGRESEEDEDAAAGDEGIEGDEGSQHEADRDADGDEGIEGDEDTESARGTVLGAISAVAGSEEVTGSP